MPARKVQRTTSAPEGLTYVEDFISEKEERDLLQVFQKIDFQDFVLQGVVAKRKVRRYGYSYEFYTPLVQEAEPFPEWLASLRDRAAPHAGLDPLRFEQALIARYDPGAGIGWHRDASAFGPSVIGISLGADETMRFRRELSNAFEMFKLPIVRRSMYILSGPARSLWQHSVPPVKELRYSITFRMVRDKYKATAIPNHEQNSSN